ncbi:hypothetical protein XELAEV_18020378mg [Xenopus laevis]|uniref:SGNH hydrolase-type esterase domain-containing protein n=1 Tax=Xenopus laevis TaxID=8355 RepID=A0A974HQL6_XENLA|nr:hypothetical protein XELAEV_18020378mg [Xenopus laevis]
MAESCQFFGAALVLINKCSPAAGLIRQISSKTDQSGKGAVLWLGTSAISSLCPIQSFKAFAAIRPSVCGPFFIHTDGSSLTKYHFTKVLHDCIVRVGLSPDDYKTHSFRIGAATQASILGFSDMSIQKLGSANLGLENVKIVWMGIQGLRWADFIPVTLQMKAKWGFPAVIFVHLGGNDIGKGRTIDLIRAMKRDLAQVHFMFPHTVLVWSEVIPRLVWLQDIYLRPLEKCRKKLNFALAKFSRTLNILVHRHHELDDGGVGLYAADRVHLSDIGLDIFNMGIQDALERALSWWGMAKPNVMC